MQNQEILNTFGKRLAYLRERSGINQQKLSDSTGISRSNLSKYEQDKVKPTSDAIVSLCEFYDVTADWLLRGIELQTQKVEAVFDPDLKEMIDIIKHVMNTNDQEQRTWAKFQLKRAFSEFSATVEEKKQHG